MTTTTQPDNTIELEWAEMMQAAQAGIMRRIECAKKGFKPAYGCGTDDLWQIDIEAALAECAVARALGVYWAGKGHWGEVDVGKCVQVRSTDYSNGRMIVRTADKDDEPFVLAVGAYGIYRIAGWLYGRECKKDEWWTTTKGREDDPAYFVPQSALRPIEKLREVVR